MYSRRNRPDTIPSLKQRIVADSIERKRDLDKLIKMVRDEERAKVKASREG